MKKTDKENPLTFFRKTNESRQKAVKNSLAKAQNGIIVNDSSANNMYKTMDSNAASNVNIMNQSILDKNRLASSSIQNPKMDSLDTQVIMQQNKDKYNSDLLNRRNKEYKDALTNRPKSNTPMMDNLFKQKQGGSVKRKK